MSVVLSKGVLSGDEAHFLLCFWGVVKGFIGNGENWGIIGSKFLYFVLTAFTAVPTGILSPTIVLHVILNKIWFFFVLVVKL